ncbi:hypothetical protein [Nesterenkonia ebinurensis]|uniref:hypothetical protein n=1 Tax=Nesterenkonia ebinurensis TaxID=2608252 RepID=UPI00168B5467|nr:hypothetical protein [Nesterenkonia ebinurensis]
MTEPHTGDTAISPDEPLTPEEVEEQIREAQQLHQQLTERLKSTEQTNQSADH